MNSLKWYLLLLMAGTVAVKAATPIDNVVRSVEQRIPEIRQLPEDTIQIQRPEFEFELPPEALADAQQRIQDLDNTALKTLDPLQELPKQLKIIDQTGKTVLIEQEAENGWRAVANEWLLVIEEKDLDELKKIDAEIINTTKFEHLDMVIVTFKVPDELNTRKILETKLPTSWISQLGRNHIYEASTSQLNDYESKNTKESGFSKSACKKPVAIGLIDTAIEKNHSALNKAKIKTKNFMNSSVPTPTAHGTAVAGILVGDRDSLKPLLPQATLYSASVFYSRNEYSQGATLINLIEALDWMAANQVRVINMSLTGPNNPILEKAIQKIADQGMIVVAAVGNEGPASRPLFPAAYTQVIGATAVDSKQQIYRWANQGEQIDFAALGVSVMTSRANNQMGRETGTSMAAPVISAMAICKLTENMSKDMVVQILKQNAIDLGVRGKDKVFGYGLIQPK